MRIDTRTPTSTDNIITLPLQYISFGDRLTFKSPQYNHRTLTGSNFISVISRSLVVGRGVGFWVNTL